MNVAVLGTGIMGGAMARCAARAGLAVAVWSRPLEDALALEPEGVRVMPTAREAVAGADVVVTMAPDASAIEGFAVGADGFLGGTGAACAQCATVGLDGCERLAALAAEAGVAFVDSPVLGTREPAERGELVVLGSGPEDALDRCAPFFEAEMPLAACPSQPSRISRAGGAPRQCGGLPLSRRARR